MDGWMDSFAKSGTNCHAMVKVKEMTYDMNIN